MADVMPCPEECERSDPVNGAARILTAPPRDGSCWLCEGRGFVPHDGNPMTPVVKYEGALDG